MSQQARKGVLLVNLGSPLSPGTADIRRYLKEFLSDKRVMTMPAVIRWLLVNLYIVPFRPAVIQKKYKRIWSEQGFPLLVHSHELTKGISAELGEDYRVILGMRYGEPNLKTCLELFQRENIQQLLVFPLFPQYSSATTGSTLEKVLDIISQWPVIPELILGGPFYDHSEFVAAWLDQAGKYVDETPDHILFSFHGLPASHILNADISGEYCLKSETCCQAMTSQNHGCYRAHCHQTANRIVTGLHLSPSQYSISFQSRLGRAKWLEPYTIDHVKKLAAQGVKKLLVFCPSFVADCLETTDEILVELKEVFLEHGGESLRLVPSLNSSQRWIESVAVMIREKL